MHTHPIVHIMTLFQFSCRNICRCQNPYFTIYATGQIHSGRFSKINYDARDYSFSIRRLSITPRDLHAVAMFNADKPGNCGQPGKWVVNVAQEVTYTRGCHLLGVQVPEEIEQILRIQMLTKQKRLLFVGEMPNSGERRAQRRRPTSFQAPLVRCRTRVSRQSGWQLHQVASTVTPYTSSKIQVMTVKSQSFGQQLSKQGVNAAFNTYTTVLGMKLNFIVCLLAVLLANVS